MTACRLQRVEQTFETEPSRLRGEKGDILRTFATHPRSPRPTCVTASGRIEVQRKGSLTLLDEWLRAELIWEDANEFCKVVIAPLREVRMLRQEPAHTFTTDRFSTNYYDSPQKTAMGGVQQPL